jgi:hypothetical protein
LHRLLGKKTLEAEILKEALEHATGSKKHLPLPPLPPKDGSRCGGGNRGCPGGDVTQSRRREIEARPLSLSAFGGWAPFFNQVS